MKKRILFTGGSGLLSVCWSNYIYRDFTVYLALHQRTIDLPNINCIKLDFSTLSSTLSALKLIKPDYVVNTAGLTSVEYCEDNHEHAFQINTLLAVNIAKACNLFNIKLVHISTDHIFDGRSSFYTENSSPNPLNIYGATKLEAENRLQDISQNFLIIRTNFYDQGPYYRRSFSDWITDKLLNNEMIYLFNDVYYTPIHILYLSQYVHQLLTLNCSGIFNVVGSDRLTKYDFGIQLAEALSLRVELVHPISIQDRSDLTVRPRDMSLDNAKVSSIVSENVSLSHQLSHLTLSQTAQNIKL